MRRATQDSPNILLIQTDQQSAETLALYGNRLVQTPNLDKLAARGVTFEHAYCNYPACSPSRSSMMTGRYASTIGVHANHMLINPNETTLPQVLKESGYQTAIIGKNHAFMGQKAKNYYSDSVSSNASILQDVFDYIRLAEHGHLVDGYRQDPEVIAAHEWAVKHCFRVPLGHGSNPARKEKCGTHLLGDTAIEYLEEKRMTDRPFFMWLSFPDPHTPYQAPEPYASMYIPEEVPLPPKDSLEGKPERQKVANMMDAMDRADDDLIRKVRAVHYGMISFIDDTLGRVFAKMGELGLMDNTVIIFTSDHGDSMGAHGLIQKHNAFYDSFTRVPFIVSLPDYKGAQRSSHMVELVDVMPTLLELAGIPIPYEVQGKSLGPFLYGDKAYVPRDYIVMESGEDGEPIRVSDITVRPEHPLDDRYFVWCAYREAWMGKGKCIRTHDWKLSVYANGDGELYNLRSDPDELVNLFDHEEYASIRSILERKLIVWSMEKENRIPENRTVKLHYAQIKEQALAKDQASVSHQ
ncbi:Arylsulfatase [Paenibacillus solanacearum]|uniref:Arylsulfatase n=1 Tax=Paenibacillus solanacearum TaxID=2048548 RepID=A0A916K1P5_9BACL|nr:sulfatase-like hydrolase/transferase [Paenibacillus solanacearum]CAG7626097.1 Arylsulfatase [Paenibacillus solanacearum]